MQDAIERHLLRVERRREREHDGKTKGVAHH
jgi:hypothetical protein